MRLFLGWVQRTWQYLRSRNQRQRGYNNLQGLRGANRGLLSVPPLLHGEYYPENILVREGTSPSIGNRRRWRQ
jgi:hypothetical protein